MLPIFSERGFTVSVAVIMASLMGSMQFAGRLVKLITENSVPVLTICIISFISMLISGWAIFLEALLWFYFFMSDTTGLWLWRFYDNPT